MLCARLLTRVPEESHGLVYRATGAFIDATIALYGRLLDRVLDHSRLTLTTFAFTIAATAGLYFLIPKGFFPVQDTGLIQAVTEASQSTSFGAMAERQQAVAEIILRDPAVSSLSSFIGVDGSNATLNTGRMLINLKPRDQRGGASVRVIMRRITESARQVGGISIFLQPVQDLTIEERVARTQYQFLMTSPDEAALRSAARDMVERLQALPQLTDVTSDLLEQGLRAFVEIDRAAATRLGVSVAGIDSALYNAFGQRLISTMYTQSNQYRVVIEVAPRYRRGMQALENLYVASSTGSPVPLSAVARIVERPGVLAINHVGQFPAVTLSFNTAEGISLGAAVNVIRDEVRRAALPPSIETGFQGAALAFQASLANTLWLILAAVVTMYIVLGVLYESFIHPVTILSTLPSAALGALAALLAIQMDLDIIAVIGIILLIGIVKKNAIMMIDFALDAERTQGMSPREAIRQACLLRFRPILMTTLAALLGALPLMLSDGWGSELRQPLGVTLVGGLIVSQLLTLFTTPVIYLGFAAMSRRWARAS
jgi:multidrug efflux pump